jgi:hypothetical protein
MLEGVSQVLLDTDASRLRVRLGGWDMPVQGQLDIVLEALAAGASS